MDTKEAGKLGGKATLSRYGKQKLKEWGKLGGRPKLDKSMLLDDDIADFEHDNEIEG